MIEDVNRVKGNLRVTCVVGEDAAYLRVWDCGFHGTPEEPKLLAETGWKPHPEHPNIASIGVQRRGEWLKALHPPLSEEEAEEEPLTEALDELLRGMEDVMRKLRTV